MVTNCEEDNVETDVILLHFGSAVGADVGVGLASTVGLLPQLLPR